MLSVKKIKEWKQDEPGRYVVKIKNLYFKANKSKNIFCDVYLEFFQGGWVVSWKGHENTVYMTKAQIEYLISKAESLDSLLMTKAHTNHLLQLHISALSNEIGNVDEISKENIIDSMKKITSKIDHNFGLPGNPKSSNVIEEKGKFYKFLANFQTHYRGNKQNKPFKFFIKEQNFKEAYRIDFDLFLENLYIFKNILDKMENENSKVKIKSVFDKEKGNNGKVIWKKKRFDNSNNSNNSK